MLVRQHVGTNLDRSSRLLKNVVKMLETCGQCHLMTLARCGRPFRRLKGLGTTMVTIFLFTKVQELQTPSQKEILEAALSKEFHDSWRDVGNGSYLVATTKPLITQDVTGLAGVTGGLAGSYIVTNLEPYFGWASKGIWEWIKTMKERDDRS